MADQCAWCRFWRRDDETSGECRRYPPRVVVLNHSAGGSSDITTFPETDPDDWCAEFQAAPKEGGA